MRPQVGILEDTAPEEIMNLARLLSPHGRDAADWYGNDPIAALGGATARQLVTRGEGDRVVRFLLDALRAERIGADPLFRPCV